MSVRCWAGILLAAGICALSAGPATFAQSLTCGDVDASQAIDIGDLSYTVDFLFFSGPRPIPIDCVGDWDASGGLDISDLSAQVDYLFFQGSPPSQNCCTKCSAGYVDCDGNQSNGCEVLLDSNPICAQPVYVGQFYAEEASCSSPTIYVLERGERFVQFLTLDCNATCVPGQPEQFNMHLVLVPPPGVDYDLYLYTDGCAEVKSSVQSGSLTEEIRYTWAGVCGREDAQFWRAEIRYKGGESCETWTLAISRF
ncbi:MAG: hypothetical protein AB1644_06440 [Candidatus Zixiibacteriota bacterium]